MDVEHVAGAEVEVCLMCFGLWLDAGELEALKARPNLQPVAVDDAKKAELFDAKRAGPKGTLNPFKKLDRGLDEFVRRYL